MINIIDKHNCCGCAACVQICPKQCISFNEDRQGFCYPSVDKQICVDCGLCEKACPVLNQEEAKKPLKVYAAKNPNEEIRMKSSSGGVFTMLAEAVIDQGGVVFGAKFDEYWEVKHDYAETKEGLAPFRGSKYVQSRIGKTYQQVKAFLNSDRKVLFTGTPCQIAGLKRFLNKEYANLFTVDVVCHGVPSPLVWRTYLNEYAINSTDVLGDKLTYSSLDRDIVITDCSFREKSTGWKKYSFLLRGKYSHLADGRSDKMYYDKNQDVIFINETVEENLFMQIFLHDLSLRPSCYKCPAKSCKSGSDFTIADFWGIENYYPELDDDKGVSLLLINNYKKNQLLESLSLDLINVNYELALTSNPSLQNSVIENKFVGLFWEYFFIDHFKNIPSLISKFKPTYFDRIWGLFKRLFYKIIDVL